MDNIFRLWFALLTIIRVSESASILSIPLYHRAMVKRETVMEHEEPNAEATADIFPADDAYAMFLGVGTPVQIVFLMIDTGSPITWFQCGPCTHCYPMRRPLFNSPASTSFRQLGCYDDTCLIPMMRGIFGNCKGLSCRYNVEYDMKSQSRSFGVMVTDTLNFEHSNVEVKDFVMGCGNSFEGPFRTQFSGVLGLGRGPLSMQSQLHSKAFSFFLVSLGSEKPSSLEFYETLPKQHGNTNKSIMVPLRENSRYPFYYFVQFVGIGINGFMLDIPSRVWGYGLNYDGGVIIDTGKVLTYLPSEAYNIFRSEILRTDGNFTKKKGYKELEFCYIESPTNVYPTVEFYFENGNIAGENFVSFKLNNRQLLITPHEGIVCLSFAEAKNSALTVIGTNHLQGTLLTYNLVDDIIIFTCNKC
ncbi:protein ASPARTIC PROTEASE IN GUARD CELL 1 [Vigna angularis]|nr:protein ASPARTIC PROTEASE IN GUARD CELL 1 [Vigna angularis]